MHNLRTAWKAFEGAGLPTRLHVLARVLTCPFTALMERFPRAGMLLDVGCGHGLLVQLLAAQPSHRGLKMQGIDHDAVKIATARRMTRPGVDFSTDDLSLLPEAAFDAVALVDVLYTVRKAAWSQVLKGCARVLKPGGRLIVKEVVDRPRWKYCAIMAQEALSVRVFGITKGDRPHFESADRYREAIAAAGFELVEERPLRSVSWISHYLFVGLKA